MKSKLIWIIVIVAIVIVGLLIFASSDIFDKCEREFKSCNDACGEGILSEVCKQKCTHERKVCKGEVEPIIAQD
ncbi:hypothetical protein ACFL0X_00545 [Nanoarchaeota archaeon]